MEHLLPVGQRAPIRVPNYQQRPDVDGKIATVDDCAGLFSAVIRQATSTETIPYDEIEALWVEYCHRGRVYNLCHALLDQFYFGLLYQILGPSIVIADFTVRDGDGHVFLSTAKLGEYLAKWLARVAQIDGNETTQHSNRIFSLLNQASLVLRHLSNFLDHSYENVPVRQAYPKDEEPLGNAHFACVLLFQALYHAWRTVFAAGQGVEIIELVSCCKSPWLQKRLEREGWCPYTIEKSSINVRTMAYGYALGTSRTDTADHGNCSKLECVANHVGHVDGTHPAKSTTEHQCRHVTDSCECWIIDAPVTEITAMLRQGEIPVLRIGTDDGYKLSLHCRKADPDKRGGRYVALSHVWIDGLGSPTANTITQCQLTRIARHIGRLEATEACGELGIWLDTLCIPVGVENQSIREQGIAQMHKVYKEAYAVIVIDADLLSLKERPSVNELGVRLYMSAWSSRLWTYQEGALNDRLLVMTADHIVDFDACMRDGASKTSHADDMLCALSEEVRNFIRDVRARRYSSRSSGGPGTPSLTGPKPHVFEQKALGMFNAIRNRTSSRPDDEATIISTYLDLGAISSALTSVDERMVALLKSMPVIPISLLFTNAPRLRIAGFRWAPNTMLEARGGGVYDLWNSNAVAQADQTAALVYKWKPMTLDPQYKGLRTVNPSIRLPKTSAYHPHVAIIVFELFGSKVQAWAVDSSSTTQPENENQPLLQFVERAMRDKKELLILMPGIFSAQYPSRGVLAEVVGEAGDEYPEGMLQLKSLAMVYVSNVDITPVSAASMIKRLVQEDGLESSRHEAEWIEPRPWLLD